MYKEIKINPFFSMMIIIVLEFILTINSYAESVKIVQWWDEYLPQKFERDAYLGYSGEVTSQQKQDLNGDGIHNDASVCRAFNLTDSFNPYPACKPDSKDGNRYRTDRPSATFYGGLIGRYTNVSDITEDHRGEQVPVFGKTGQATIQPVEGAKPNLYDNRYPHNTRRAGGSIGGGIEWGLGWADITFWLTPQNGFEFFEIEEDIEQNFTFIAIWKKEDFVNGGATAQKIVFDSTSKISVDVTRVRDTEESRFIVQDGSQLWVSEYTYDARDKPSTMVELNPLSSRWAIYEPSDCGMEFNLKTANFTEHTFQDVQAVGVYFANRQFAHKPAGICFDNFQAYAVTDSAFSESSTGDQRLAGLAVNSEGKSVSTDAQFSQDITVNGSTVTVNASDQMDIRGVITVDNEHIDKEAEIIVVVGFTPASSTEELFFMFDQYGKVLPWDGNMDNLVAYEKTDLIKNKEGKRVKRNIILMPERRVQIFPVSLSSFRDKQLDTILLGCEERPLTYSGLLNEVPPGLLRFFFGYRLKKEGTIIYNRESINVVVTSD